MFTGIIEDIGKITGIKANRLSVETSLNDIKIGDSIAVNGICLTVTDISLGTLGFDFSPETAVLTTLGSLKKGDSVNIERALKMGDRLGGHFLTGHIEALGKIISIKKEDNSYIFKISIPEHLCKYVILKGSIGVDGISLTVTEKAKGYFNASVIPHTIEKTVLKMRKPGDMLNIETDVMAKYAENTIYQSNKTGLTIEKLKENGFI